MRRKEEGRLFAYSVWVVSAGISGTVKVLKHHQPKQAK